MFFLSMCFDICFPSEGLFANLALERPFSRLNHAMAFEMMRSRKSHVAVLAFVWSFVTVDAIMMGFKMIRSRKSHVAVLAFVWSFVIVNAIMLLEMAYSSKAFIA